MSDPLAQPDLSVTPESPWLGLRSFTEAAQPYFFGRTEELDDLYERILDKPLTVLFGQSGLGKSSLLQAALMPRLRAAGLLPILIRLDHNTGAPPLEHQLLDRLRATLDLAGYTAPAASIASYIVDTKPSLDPAAFLWMLFHDPALGFIPQRGRMPQDSVRPAFLIDQFEEIFTLGDRSARRAFSLGFRETLAGLIENHVPPSLRAVLEKDDDLAERLDYKAQGTRVLLSLREDFLHLLERWRRVIPSLMENRMELRMLSGPQALLAVVRPGQLRQNLPPIIPDDVGQAIVRFVAGVESNVPLDEIDAVPPLLSLVCAELNSQRIASGEVQITQAQFEGHSSDILSSFYLRSFDLPTYGSALDGIVAAATGLSALRRLIEDRLLSADGFRESIAFDTIARDLSQAADTEAAKAVLHVIVERRLLTVEERGGVRRMELAHDVLTRIVRASRDERMEKEALEKARIAKETAEREAAAILVQRNQLRRWVVIAALCTFIAAVGAIAGWVGVIRAHAASMQAKDEQAQAEAGFKAARDATDKMVAKIADKDLAYVPGIQDLREEMARQACQQYTALLARQPGDASLRMGLLRARASQASILDQIGSVSEAVEAYDALLIELRQAKNTVPSDDLDLLIADVEKGYDRFNQVASLPRNQELDDDIGRIGERLKTGKNRAKGLLYLSYACNSDGNWQLKTPDKIASFKKAKDYAQTAYDSDKTDIDSIGALSAAMFNLGRQYASLLTKEDKQKGLALMADADVLDQKQVDARPDSPVIKIEHALGLEQRAIALNDSGDQEQAQTLFDRAITDYRLTSEANPRVTLYAAWLASGLKDYAAFLSEHSNYIQARKCYDEGVGLLEKLVVRRDDRPGYDTDLLEMLSQVASFEQGGKGEDRSNINPEAAADVRDKAIKYARQFMAKYPDDLQVAYDLGSLIEEQTTHDPLQKDDEACSKLLEEAVQAMDAHFARSPQQVNSVDAEEYMRWVQDLDAVYKRQQSRQSASPDILVRRVKLLETAVGHQSFCTGPNAKDELLSVGSRLAKIMLTTGRAEDAVQLQLKLIAFCEPEYKQKPYFYFLRDALGWEYDGLARAYRAEGNKQEEIKAWQQWVRVAIVPVYGDAYDKWLDPNLPLSDATLHGLRAIEEQLPPKKGFTVYCESGGVKIPITFYLANIVPAQDADPVADQARWLAEERGLIMPDSARTELRNLANLAHKNNEGYADVVSEYLNADPLADADSQLADARSRLADVKKETAELTPRLDAAKEDLKNALAFAADQALENAKWDKFKEYVQASVVAGNASPILSSKIAILTWQNSGRQAAFDAFAASWGDADFRTAAAADFQLLDRSSDGKRFIDAMSAWSIKTNPPLHDALAGAVLAVDKATYVKELDEALKSVQTARETYKKDDTAANKEALAGTLLEAANYAMYAQRWPHVIALSREAEQLDPAEPGNYGNEATGLLFEGKYNEALAVYRQHWMDAFNEVTLGDSTLDDYASLAEVGIVSPDTERMHSQICAELPSLNKAQAAQRSAAASKMAAAKESEFYDNMNDDSKRAVLNACAKASLADLFAGKLDESEKFAHRCVELDEKALVSQLRLAEALLYQGKYDQASVIYQLYWSDPWSTTTFGGRALSDFKELELAGITHPDVQRVRQHFATPTTAPTTRLTASTAPADATTAPSTAP